MTVSKPTYCDGLGKHCGPRLGGGYDCLCPTPEPKELPKNCVEQEKIERSNFKPLDGNWTYEA